MKFKCVELLLASSQRRPAYINLSELFYCSAMRDSFASAKEQVVFETKDGFVGCAVTKVSAAEVREVLLEYTGLTLAETHREGLVYFTYLPKFNAYFNVHGDTNYRSRVDIIAGERVKAFIELKSVNLYRDSSLVAEVI